MEHLFNIFHCVITILYIFVLSMAEIVIQL